MKFLFVFAICVAAASARMIGPISAVDEEAEIKEIIAAINSPHTDLATAAALQSLLNHILGLSDEPTPISVGPAIIDEFEPISVDPAIVEEPVADASSPLVQIIINVKSSSHVAIPEPVIVDDGHFDDIQVDPVVVVEQPEIEAEPVIVVDQPEIESEPVNVVDLPDLIQPPEVGPIAPIVVPDILN